MKTSFVCACALLCLWVGLAVAQPATLIPPITNICGLQGYDLNTLQHAGFWKFTVTDKSQCIIPPGKSPTDVLNCTIFFSVCHPIEDNTLCPGENSSICQEVAVNGEPVRYYNLGTYNPAHNYLVSADGFLANRNGSMVNGSGCDRELNVQIAFNCDPSAHWNLESTDITKYRENFIRNPTDACEFIAEVAYRGACYIPPTLGPNTCQLDAYNVHTLAEQDYWYANVSKSYCYDSSNIDTCTFYFSFCHPVPPEVNGKCYENGVCQIGERTGSSKQVYGMGLFTNMTRFIPNTGDVDGGFHVDYQNGSTPICTHQNGIRTQIVLSCNHSVSWTQQDQTNNIYVTKTSQCAYTLELQYSGACESEYPTEEETSFIGWIFIGIFLGLVAIYLMVGSAYQYFGKQERGLRILPNYDFWKAFVLSVLEGCKYCLDFVTCSKFTSSSGKVKYDNI